MFEKEEYRDAIKKWEEVIKIDRENSEALDGIEKSRKRIEEEKKKRENIFREKQYKLMNFHEKGLPPREFDEAMIILKKDPSTYTEKEKKLSNYIEELLKGNFSIENYIDIRNTLMEEK